MIPSQMVSSFRDEMEKISKITSEPRDLAVAGAGIGGIYGSIHPWVQAYRKGIIGIPTSEYQLRSMLVGAGLGTAAGLGAGALLKRKRNKEKTSADLTAAARNDLKKKEFAIPELRKYPIHDENHARAALSMVAAHGTPEQQSRVRAAVAKKYPGINVTGAQKKKKE
jgi:hypothetical protein